MTAGQNDELWLVRGILASFARPPAAPPSGDWAAPGDLSAVDVLDCGGGTGRLAVPLARLGASVTVVDISADALATLARRAAEADVAQRVHPVQGDVEALSEAIGPATFDLVLAHGVLDAVNPAALLAGVRAALRPAGAASLVVTNPAATVLSRILAGDLEGAVSELRRWDYADGSLPRLDAAELMSLCADAGLDVEQIGGVGVFTELIPKGLSAGVTPSGNSVADLAVELEELSRRLTPFREIASRLHVLARPAPVVGG